MGGASNIPQRYEVIERGLNSITNTTLALNIGDGNGLIAMGVEVVKDKGTLLIKHNNTTNKYLNIGYHREERGTSIKRGLRSWQ